MSQLTLTRPVTVGAEVSCVEAVEIMDREAFDQLPRHPRRRLRHGRRHPRQHPLPPRLRKAPTQRSRKQNGDLRHRLNTPNRQEGFPSTQGFPQYFSGSPSARQTSQLAKQWAVIFADRHHWLPFRSEITVGISNLAANQSGGLPLFAPELNPSLGSRRAVQAVQGDPPGHQPGTPQSHP